MGWASPGGNSEYIKSHCENGFDGVFWSWMSLWDLLFPGNVTLLIFYTQTPLGDVTHFHGYIHLFSFPVWFFSQICSPSHTPLVYVEEAPFADASCLALA